MPKDSDNPWKKLTSEVVYKNKWYEVRRDEVVRPDGQRGEYNVMDGPDGAFIAALDDDHNIYMIRKYRYPTDMMSLEVPAGGIDPNEEPLAAAQRELQEEAGLAAKNWKLLGKFQAENAYTSNFGYLFAATGISMTDENEQLVEGIINTEKISLSQAFQMIQTGEITDCQTISCLMMLALELGLVQLNGPTPSPIA
jgi:ADP-ribose pyrophosphatase